MTNFKEEVRKEFEEKMEVWLAIRAVKIASKDGSVKYEIHGQIKDLIDSVIDKRDAELNALWRERITRAFEAIELNGHGGGNFRRLIVMVRDMLLNESEVEK